MQAIFTFLSTTVTGVLTLTALAVLLLMQLLSARSKPAAVGKTYVAEVWLEWPICRGSTLYRASFRWRWWAIAMMRYHALKLDWILPTHYRASDWSGRAYLERHEYGIFYGLRQPTDFEQVHGVTSVWSPVMPGYSGYSGEHASAHPLNGPRLAELDGVKL